MKEAEIAGYILEHDARNLQLRRRLAERGINGRSLRRITCRFRAPSQQQGRHLAQKLEEKGFIQVAVEATPEKRGGACLLYAEMRAPLDRAASHEFTEQMVRGAAEAGVFSRWLEARVEGWNSGQVQLAVIKLVLQAGGQVINVAGGEVAGNALIYEGALIAAHCIPAQLDEQALQGGGVKLLR